MGSEDMKRHRPLPGGRNLYKVGRHLRSAFLAASVAVALARSLPFLSSSVSICLCFVPVGVHHSAGKANALKSRALGGMTKNNFTDRRVCASKIPRQVLGLFLAFR